MRSDQQYGQSGVGGVTRCKIEKQCRVYEEGKAVEWWQMGWDCASRQGQRSSVGRVCVCVSLSKRPQRIAVV